GAVVDDLDGLARFPREKSGVTCNHGRIFLLAAEPAAGFGLHDADVVFRKAKKTVECFVHVVGALQRAPHRYAVGWICLRDHALRLDIELLLRAGFVVALDNEIGSAPSSLNVTFFHTKG